MKNKGIRNNKISWNPSPLAGVPTRSFPVVHDGVKLGGWLRGLYNYASKLTYPSPTDYMTFKVSSNISKLEVDKCRKKDTRRATCVHQMPGQKQANAKVPHPPRKAFQASPRV